MSRFFSRLSGFISSKRFFAVVASLFVLQGIFFVFTVAPSYQEVQPSGYVTRGGGVVPDGNRHIGAMYFYAERPLLSGPIVNDMADEELWLGDLERFPSYLYQYVFSFFVRAGLSLGMSDWSIVVVIRLATLVLGLLALVVFRRIALQIRAGPLVANISSLALAVTGSFVWLSAAENYDIPALLLWLLFVLSSLRLFMQRDATQLYWMAVIFFILSVTKYTYIPFMGLSGLVALWLFARGVGYRSVIAEIRSQWSLRSKALKRWQVIGLVVLGLVSSGLFVERVGVNLVSHQSISPDCTQIHTHEACMNFGVYSRNYNRSVSVENWRADEFELDVLHYTGAWVARYYNSMYAYMGHIWINEYWLVMQIVGLLFLAVVAGLAIYTKTRRVKLLRSTAEWYILFLSVVLIFSQYLFNLRSFINHAGAMYAHQGRYLLPAVGFVYLIVVIIMVRSVRNVPEKSRQVVKLLLVLLAVASLLFVGAITSFFVHADSLRWYSDFVEVFVPGWLL